MTLPSTAHASTTVTFNMTKQTHEAKVDRQRTKQIQNYEGNHNGLLAGEAPQRNMPKAAPFTDDEDATSNKMWHRDNEDVKAAIELQFAAYEVIMNDPHELARFKNLHWPPKKPGKLIQIGAHIDILRGFCGTDDDEDDDEDEDADTPPQATSSKKGKTAKKSSNMTAKPAPKKKPPPTDKSRGKKASLTGGNTCR